MRCRTDRLWGVAALLLLGGCAVPQPPGPAEDRDEAAAAYEQRAERLSGLAGWRLDGRVVAQGAGESGQARIRWSRSDGDGRLAVRNPFGQTVLELRSGPEGLRLKDDQGGIYRGERAHAVLRHRLGWRVPVGRLADWALGLARGDGVPGDLDDHGRPRYLTADGWTVAFTEYMKVDGLWLPQVMRVSREDMRLRIRVREWRLEWRDDGKQGRQA